jgi:hypothetical protein
LSGDGPSGVIAPGCLAEKQEKRQHGASTNNLPKEPTKKSLAKKPPGSFPHKKRQSL